MGTIGDYLQAKLGEQAYGKLLDAMNACTVKPRGRRRRGKK